MRILIVEDDLTSRKIMLKILSAYGECDVTVDGLEAVDAFMLAQKENKPYDLVCLDIMMPKLDGVKVLKVIRSLEEQKNVLDDNQAKVIMTTALSEKQYVDKAFELGCQAYASKPIDAAKFKNVLEKMKLI